MSPISRQLHSVKLRLLARRLTQTPYKIRFAENSLAGSVVSGFRTGAAVVRNGDDFDFDARSFG
jgi:hypothetical protein